jgi:hypothetical protein
MKKTILFFAAILSLGTSMAQVHVKEHVKSNGTIVQEYWRSNPDYIRDNNYGGVGNINPYTGSVGTKPGGYNNSCCNPPKNYYPSVPRYNYSIPNNYNW